MVYGLSDRIKRNKSVLLPFVCLLLLTAFLACGCGQKRADHSSFVTSGVEADSVSSVQGTSASGAESSFADATQLPDPDGWYSSRDEVALYLHTYGHLPGNYLTKQEARALGWDAEKGNLREVAPGKSIGGDVFGNRERLLPAKDGRVYYECDIDYEGGRRNAKRIVFSDDGLIFYTEDHYASYEQLY